MKTKQTIVFLLAALLLALPVWAQVSTSSITGQVSDSTGAVVAAAKVQAKNEASGVTYESTSTPTGNYAFSSLTPGQYTITVSQKGFQTYVSTRNVLTVGTPLVVDITLTVGAQNETVEVQSNYERVETSNATISDVMTETQVKNLPLNGRNPLTLLTLEPGVVQRTTNGTGSGTHVFGSRDRAHNVTIDGIDANESTVPSPTSNIQRLNPDNVQEFRTVTLGATAENGRNSGANVMVATKQGSNAVHGDVFEFLRNNALNSNEWYNSANKQPVPKLNLNQFGFDVGGPIIKNKTFWFTSFQHNIIKESAPIASFFGVPLTYSPALRSGVFRYVKGTVNGLTRNSPALVDANGNLVAGATPCATASSTNCIASYNITGANDPQGIGTDPKMLALAKGLPLPNAYSSGGDGLNNGGFLWNPPTKFTGPNVLVRIDHTFNESNNVFVRWLQNTYDTKEGDFLNARPEVYPGFPPLGEVNRLGKNLAASYRHTFTPNLVNELTAGFNRFAFVFTFGESNPGFTDATKNPPYGDDCVYGSTTTMTSPYCASAHTARAVTAPQIIDNLSWVHGNHTIRTGINFRFYIHNDSRGFFGSTIAGPGVIFGSARIPSFLDPVTGKPLNTESAATIRANLGINSTDQTNLYQAIDELAGIPRTVTKSFVADFNANKYLNTPYATVYTRAHQYDTFIQDEWKLRPNLTLNGGVRWEFNPAPYDAKQTLVPDKFVDGSQGPVTFVKSDRWTKNNNIASLGPRFGFAYSPDSKTSIRGGYSWLFDVVSTFQVTAIAGKVPGFMLGCPSTITAATTAGAADSISTAAGCAAPSGLTNRINTGFPLDVPAPSVTPSVALLQPAQSRSTAPSVGALDQNLKNPSVHEWSLTVQRELPLRLVAEVGYIGKRGTHLQRAYDLNQIDATAKPGFLDSFNIARNNVLKGCNPDATGCPAGVTGQAPALLLSLVTGSFLNSTVGTTTFIRNNIGTLATTMDNLSATSSSRVNLPLNYFRPNPQFNQIFFQDSGGDSYYHGLFISARRRFEQGVTFGFSYTWSKSIDDMSVDPTGASTGGGLSTTNSRTPTDIHNFRLDRAVSDFDNTHVFISNLLYEFPFGRGKKFASGAPRWLDTVIGGWQISGIFNYQSGEPLTLLSGSFTTNSQHTSSAVIIGDKPGNSLVYKVPASAAQSQTAGGGPVIYTTGGFIQPVGTNFNPADLNCQVFLNGKTKVCIPAAGQQGSGRNAVRGQNLWNLDSGLMKNFKLTERFNLQFRAEFFNVLNHPNFENPRNATVGSPTITSTNFGTVCCSEAAISSSAQVNPIGEPSRVIGLGLKLTF
jgi:hypothetical protein